MESNAWKAFRDSGEPAYAEFGTPLPSLWKSVKNILTEVTGLGQGEPPHPAQAHLNHVFEFEFRLLNFGICPLRAARVSPVSELRSLVASPQGFRPRALHELAEL